MGDYTLGAVESRFADLIWKEEPISSTALWKQCEHTFGWKKSTTFTVLKRLCDKGIFQNNGGTVTSLLTREEFYARRSEQFVDEAFDGSLPAFLAAFTARKTLSPKEVEELRRMVAEYEEG